MKKFLAMMLMVTALLFAGVAAAEAPVVEVPFEGVWVQFEEGFEVMLPANWLEIEVTEEMIAGGIFYAACSEDGANTVQMSWSALENAMTAQEVQAEIEVGYPGAQIMEFNGVEFVTFVDQENDIFGMIALDGVDLGMYTFWFTPNSDEAFVDTAVAIATSIRNIEE